MIPTILAFLGSGLGTTILTEAVSAVNKRLSGTPADGAGAFILSGAIAFLMGSLQVATTGVGAPDSLRDVAETTAAVWIASQVFFQLVLKKINAVHVTPSTDFSVPLS